MRRSRGPAREFVERLYDACVRAGPGVKRRVVRSLVAGYRGTEVPVAWPPGARCVIGPRSAVLREKDGNEGGGGRWRFGRYCRHGVCVIGALRVADAFLRDMREICLLLDVVSDEILGYSPRPETLYVLGEDILSFVRHGARRAAEYYEIPYLWSALEHELYGVTHADEGLLDALSGCSARQALRIVRSAEGRLVKNTDDDCVFMFGTLGYLEAARDMPMCVSKCLRNLDYVVIGKVSLLERIVLLHAVRGDVYLLLTGGFVLKAADSLLGFLRMRCLALSWCHACCFARRPDRAPPVGACLSFGCGCGYRSPLDPFVREWMATYRESEELRDAYVAGCGLVRRDGRSSGRPRL